MIDSIVAAAIIVSIAYLFMRVSLVWYDRRVGAQRERLLAQQYRLFALRDRAFRMLAEGQVPPEDADWYTLYEHLNESAKLPSVQEMHNSREYALALLTKAPPCVSGEFREVSPKLRPLWDDYTKIVIDICKRGIACNKRAPSEVVRKRLEKEHKDTEAVNFDRWESTDLRKTASGC